MFLICVCGLGFLAASLGISRLVDAVRQYEVAGAVQQVVEVNSLLFSIAEKLATERSGHG